MQTHKFLKKFCIFWSAKAPLIFKSQQLTFLNDDDGEDNDNDCDYDDYEAEILIEMIIKIHETQAKCISLFSCPLG